MHSTTNDECYDPALDLNSLHPPNVQDASPTAKENISSAPAFKQLLAQFVCTSNAHKPASRMKPYLRNSTDRMQSDALQLSITKRLSPEKKTKLNSGADCEDWPMSTGSTDDLPPPLHPSTHLKRSASTPITKIQARPSKKIRTTTQLREQVLVPAGSVDNKLVDSLRPGLLLVMVGVNPSIETGKTGHAYSHPTNKFWKLLHESNITPIRHQPRDTHALMDLYGIGHTNVVSAASVAEKDIPKAIYQAGMHVLDEKIRELKPQVVALVGKNVWENWFQYKNGRRFNAKKDAFAYGWQEDDEMRVGRTVAELDAETEAETRKNVNVQWEGARVYVLPTSSAACAFWNKDGVDTRIEYWKPLGEWFTPKRLDWIDAHAAET